MHPLVEFIATNGTALMVGASAIAALVIWSWSD